MSRVIKSLMIVLLLLSFAACAQLPVFTVEVLKTPTPPPLAVEPTFTVTPPAKFSTSAASPTAPFMPADFSPILYGKKYDANTFFLLLGGVQGEVWLAPDLAAVQFGQLPTSMYDVYTFAENNFQVEGDAPQFSPPHKLYTIGTNVSVDEPGMVGVAQGWSVVQRAARELTGQSELYRQVVLDWLTAEGVTQPQIDQLQILRVDIEGDGVDEIFISATHLDESQHTTRAGDYSILLMRKVAGNEAVTLPIVGDIYHSADLETTYPNTYSVANFIDLNRDEVLEVIVDIQGWEKTGAIIYQIDGQDILETLRVE